MRGKSRGVKTILLLGTALVAGCASNPARTSVAVPLEIPEPPPRVALDPIPAIDVPQTERLPAVPATAPSVRSNTPPAPSATAASSSPAPPTPPAAAAPVEPPRATPPAELRPAGPAGRTPSVTQVQDSLARTKKKLDAIDRRRLNAGKRADYDSARRFLGQAEAAVKGNNLMLAESSVEKAETLADGLR